MNGKYARIERERRFWLATLPPGFAPEAAHALIDDRYIRGTRFRLRRMAADGATVMKLTQKYDGAGDLARVTITNTYLTEAEYGVFAALAADELRKRRYRYARDGVAVVIDLFEGPLAGLALAELEFASDSELEGFAPPAWLGIEVTRDPRFSGGELCRRTAPPEPPSGAGAEL